MKKASVPSTVRGPPNHFLLPIRFPTIDAFDSINQSVIQKRTNESPSPSEMMPENAIHP